MISSDILRGYNESMILWVLLKGDSYGYEVAKKIKDATQNLYIMKETTLYSAFSRLEKNGYVISYQTTQENGKKRTYYTLTQAGKIYYNEKVEEWQQTKIIIEKFF